jgi:hypothetical protein
MVEYIILLVNIIPESGSTSGGAVLVHYLQMYCTVLYLLAPTILKITVSDGHNLINMMIS